jgi:hypothetical protein
MTTLNEQTAKAKERLEQIKRKQRLQKHHEERVNSAKVKKRNGIIGELFSISLPDMSDCFTPMYSKSDNEVEFAPLNRFFTALAKHPYFISKLMVDVGWDEPPLR